jgi:hypothetical protein
MNKYQNIYKVAAKNTVRKLVSFLWTLEGSISQTFRMKVQSEVPVIFPINLFTGSAKNIINNDFKGY